MFKINTTHALFAYSVVLTMATTVVVLTGAAKPTNASFDQITVKRINLVEPNGTLRLVIANKSLMPGNIIKGKEYKNKNRNAAGLVFYNDEGSENGGLVFGGKRDLKGVARSFGHLSFDQYEQDQMFALDAIDDGGKRTSMMTLADFPSYSIEKIIEFRESIKELKPEQKDAAWAKFEAENGSPHLRVTLGRRSDDSVGFSLYDRDGHPRLVFKVGANGTPSIQALDAKGTVTSDLMPNHAG
ncbi:hypothetical protein EJMOOK_15835 [Rhodanobacter sp. Root179]|uniref:hypothetical protein n=1 Tax=Rhodanobacter sp. Root179 TaxID=1736482 RepID=UPI000B143070|nr:hypothetical protein [Rhodanobacter sp. Root179]